MNTERLLNIAKALRESPKPEKFDMNKFGHHCGTPACALGHYAARPDLQSVFRLERDGHVSLVASGPESEVWYTDLVVLDHFDISHEDTIDLFDPDGCNHAETAAAAAAYIEAFVAGGER